MKKTMSLLSIGLMCLVGTDHCTAGSREPQPRVAETFLRSKQGRPLQCLEWTSRLRVLKLPIENVE